ncbi:hypothetical protein LCGC14_0767710 [marine sediment metagenome]|uniref:Uncharacterized protein n=1 Tax=marine sediment metagenome TaxID=412755 RepID=A0A0F9SJ90_9ZZZZ
MDTLEVMIKKLCMDCNRRSKSDICGENKPSYINAYKCKWDDAQREFKKMRESFSDTK